MNLAMQSRLTLGLAAACGLCALLLVLFWAGVGRGYGFGSAEDERAQKLPSLAGVKDMSFTMPGYASYAEVTQRPLFSIDRRPIPIQEKQAEATPEKPPQPLRVELTGIILTPEVQLALLMDKASNQPISVKEGMPLPGDQSAWVLVELEPRKAVFKNNLEQVSEVALDVSEVTAEAPASARRTGPEAAPEQGSAPAQAKAEDEDATGRRKINTKVPVLSAGDAKGADGASLRERIAKRRAELRERAEQIREQRQKQQQEQESNQ